MLYRPGVAPGDRLRGFAPYERLVSSDGRLQATTLKFSLGEHQRADFNRDGAVLLPRLIGGDQLDMARLAVDRALQQSDNYFRRLRVWETDAQLRQLCIESHLPAVVAELLKSGKVNLFYDQVFTKEPGSGVATPWHNDLPYWPVRGRDVMTIWLALW